jgi:hypothetical protein
MLEELELQVIPSFTFTVKNARTAVNLCTFLRKLGNQATCWPTYHAYHTSPSVVLSTVYTVKVGN